MAIGSITQEWGWYWISDCDEEDWGWVTYHYGRWIFDRDMGGWVWRSGNEWAPAWVAWRRGDDNIGWMAMPPDELSADYDDAPDFWVFVAPRYLADPGISRAHGAACASTRGAARQRHRRAYAGARAGRAKSPAKIPALSRRLSPLPQARRSRFIARRRAFWPAPKV